MSSKHVTTYTTEIADTIRLDLPAGSEILGVARAPRGISFFVLSLVEQAQTRLRFFRVVLGQTTYESDVTEEYVGTVVFGSAEAYHVFEIPHPDRGTRDRRLGL